MPFRAHSTWPPSKWGSEGVANALTILMPFSEMDNPALFNLIGEGEKTQEALRDYLREAFPQFVETAAVAEPF